MKFTSRSTTDVALFKCKAPPIPALATLLVKSHEVKFASELSNLTAEPPAPPETKLLSKVQLEKVTSESSIVRAPPARVVSKIWCPWKTMLSKDNLLDERI